MLSQVFRRELGAKEPVINGTLDNAKTFLAEMPREGLKQRPGQKGMKSSAPTHTVQYAQYNNNLKMLYFTLCAAQM